MKKSAVFRYKSAILDLGLVFRFILGSSEFGVPLLMRRMKNWRSLAHRWVAAVDAGYDERSRIYPAYKQHRIGAFSAEQRSLIADQLKKFRWYCQIEGISLYQAKGWEADDVIATWVNKSENQPALIVGQDKDLLQLLSPQVEILRKLDEEPYTVLDFMEEFGISPQGWITLQALKGDSCDNVPGVRGIGIKKGLALIKKYGANLDYDDPAFALSKQLVTLRSDLELEELPKEELPEEFVHGIRRADLIQQAVFMEKKVW